MPVWTRAHADPSGEGSNWVCPHFPAPLEHALSADVRMVGARRRLRPVCRVCMGNVVECRCEVLPEVVYVFAADAQSQQAVWDVSLAREFRAALDGALDATETRG